METTEDKSGIFESLLEKAETYGKTTYDLYKLKAVDKTATTVSSAVSHVVAAILLLMCLSIASIGVAWWLGAVLGKVYYGFFCVAGFYALLGIILLVVKNNFIRKGVENAIIENTLN